MITKIKNISSRKISFDTFEIAKDEVQDLLWDKAILTPLTFSQVLKAYRQGKLQVLDEAGNIVSLTIRSEYFIRDENGQDSAEPFVQEIDGVLLELNKRYNKMLQE